MVLLLDTNIISRLRRLDRAPPEFGAWARSIRLDEVYLSVVTVMELENGILSVAGRDPPFAQVLRDWQAGLLSEFAARIVPIDTAIALRCARLQSQRSIDVADALIAATALEGGFALVTHNMRHFADFGLTLINPFLA